MAEGGRVAEGLRGTTRRASALLGLAQGQGRETARWPRSSPAPAVLEQLLLHSILFYVLLLRCQVPASPSPAGFSLASGPPRVLTQQKPGAKHQGAGQGLQV